MDHSLGADHYLPFFLKHYRGMGIREFWFYADRCNSRTRQLLNAQSDVTIIGSEFRYGDYVGQMANGAPRRFVQFIKEFMCERMFSGRWVLTVDVDEFLVLPPPATSIDELVRALERVGQDYCFAPLIDFYPKTLAQRNYATSLSPFRGCRYFDAGPYHRFDPIRNSLMTLYSGPRERIGMLLAQRHPVEMSQIYGTHPQVPALNYKIPLIKHGSRIARIGCHKINETPTLNLSAALAHFKFCPSLDEKLKRALKEGQYYRSSMEYRFLKLALDKLPNVSLIWEGTREFAGADSLAAADLLGTIG